MVILSSNPKASVTLSLRRGAWCAYGVWSGVWLFLGHANKYYYRDIIEFWNLLKNIDEKYREEIDMHLIGLRLHISYVAAVPFLGGPPLQICNLQMVLIGMHHGPIWYICAHVHTHIWALLWCGLT